MKPGPKGRLAPSVDTQARRSRNGVSLRPVRGRGSPVQPRALGLDPSPASGPSLGASGVTSLGGGVRAGAITATTPHVSFFKQRLQNAGQRVDSGGKPTMHLRLRKAAKLVGMGAALQGSTQSQDQHELRVWREWQRRNAAEARMLGRGTALCDCIDPYPSNGYNPTKLCARGKLQWAIIQAHHRSYALTLTLVSLLYLPISMRILGFFVCEEVGASWRLRGDMSYECFDEVWMRYLPLVTLALLLFTVCVPLLLLVSICRARKAHVEAYIEFLTTPYVPSTENVYRARCSTHWCSERCFRTPARCALWCYLRRNQRRINNLDELRMWQWDTARRAVGATPLEAQRSGSKHSEVMVGVDVGG